MQITYPDHIRVSSLIFSFICLLFICILLVINFFFDQYLFSSKLANNIFIGLPVFLTLFSLFTAYWIVKYKYAATDKSLIVINPLNDLREYRWDDCTAIRYYYHGSLALSFKKNEKKSARVVLSRFLKNSSTYFRKIHDLAAPQVLKKYMEQLESEKISFKYPLPVLILKIVIFLCFIVSGAFLIIRYTENEALLYTGWGFTIFSLVVLTNFILTYKQFVISKNQITMKSLFITKTVPWNIIYDIKINPTNTPSHRVLVFSERGSFTIPASIVNNRILVKICFLMTKDNEKRKIVRRVKKLRTSVKLDKWKAAGILLTTVSFIIAVFFLTHSLRIMYSVFQVNSSGIETQGTIIGKKMISSNYILFMDIEKPNLEIAFATQSSSLPQESDGQLPADSDEQVIEQTQPEAELESDTEAEQEAETTDEENEESGFNFRDLFQSLEQDDTETSEIMLPQETVDNNASFIEISYNEADTDSLADTNSVIIADNTVPQEITGYRPVSYDDYINILTGSHVGIKYMPDSPSEFILTDIDSALKDTVANFILSLILLIISFVLFARILISH